LGGRFFVTSGITIELNRREMFFMPVQIRLVVCTIALLVAGWMGHGIGSARLEEARAQLAALQKSGQTALAAQTAARQQLADELQSQKLVHEARLRELNQSFDAQKVEMAEAFDEIQERLLALNGQRQSTDTELRRVRHELAAATSTPAREELNRREAQLVVLQRQLKRLQAGLNCLQAPVPDEAVTTLNRVTGGRVMASAARTR
jgi:predicted  nucleic acid-binding Zn-ribbon protein